MKHTQDSDCSVDPVTDLCTVCGVHHGEPCEHCGGRGFHRVSPAGEREAAWREWATFQAHPPTTERTTT